jgi:DNA polymerase-3 subunit beta
MDVAFNVKWPWISRLKVINTTEIQIQLNTPTSPYNLSPLGSLKMTYLVMPVTSSIVEIFILGVR